MSLPKPYYEHGGITIYHGDCREILPHLPKGLTVTDPPYNVGYHHEGYADNLSVEDYQSLLLDSCRLPCVLIHYAEDLCAMSWTLEEIPDKMVAWVYPSNTARQWRGIAWWGAKPDFSLDGQDYKNPEDKRIKERIANGNRCKLYDWREVDQVKNVSAEKTDHPCQIPLTVMLRILTVTPSELVIDPFMGSGTTLRAAKDLGRQCIGIELEEKYAEIAARRLEQEVLF